MILFLQKHKHLPVLTIILLGVITHFLFFGHPMQVVFDEVHFGGFVSGYFTHEYYFDIHPPLGKLIIAGVGYLAGFTLEQSFSDIGNNFNDELYLWLRITPTIAGILLPLVIYLISRELKLSKTASILIGLAIILENALLVLSRFILLDSFLLLFGFTALLSYLRYLDTKRPLYIIGAFLFSTLAISIKWTALTFLGVIGLAELIFIIQARSWRKLRQLILLTFGAMLIYTSFFYIHLSLLNRSGLGDAYMSDRFKATLIDSDNIYDTEAKPLYMVEKIIELNYRMYTSNTGLDATHPYSTNRYTPEEELEENKHELPFYTWPLMARPIYYWNDSIPSFEFEDGIAREQRIYLLGNPTVWYGGTFAILYLMITIVFEIPKIIKTRKNTIPPLLLILLGLYLINFIPFGFISRGLYLYHYFVALIISIIALGYFVDSIKKKRPFAIIFLVIALITFIFFLPFTYGLELTNPQYELLIFDFWK